MDCWYPITIPRRSNRTNPRNNIVYQVINGTLQVPCGRCPACRRRKQNEWAFRIMEECKFSKVTAFVTLTYDDVHLPFSPSGIPTLFPEHLTKFFKDLRYDIGSFRYFACGEYGDQFDRPHYHFILFYNGNFLDDDLSGVIQSNWPYGFIDFEPGVTAGRSKYCAKYTMKQIGFDYQDSVPPFARMSRRPGIGKKFLDQTDVSVFRKHQLWFVHDYQGTPYSLPRYYKERIYSSDECEEHSLLLERLKSYKIDSDMREFSFSNPCGYFFKSKAYDNYNRERLFIKHLKKENYGFKFSLQKKERERFRNSADDFSFNEFDSQSPRFD